MSKFCVPIVPFFAHGLDHNVVQVSVDYDARRGGPVANLVAFQDREGVMTTVLFGSPHVNVVVEGGWKRNNKKKLEVVSSQVKDDVLAGRGPVFGAIEGMLVAVGSGVKGGGG